MSYTGQRNSTDIARATATLVATVADTATLSGILSAQGYATGGIAIPSTFDGTAIGFQVCESQGGTFQDLYDATNTIISKTVGASRSYPLPSELLVWPFFKIKCGTAQTGATAFPITLKG